MEENKDRSYSRREVLKKAGLGLAATASAGALAGAAAPLSVSAKGVPALSRQQKTTVTVTGQLDQNTKKLTAMFEHLHPDIKLNYININAPDWDSFFTKILTLIAAGQAPDVVNVATEGLNQFAAHGLGVPLDDYVKRDKAEMAEFFADVHPTLVEAEMYKGSLYVLPTDFNAVDMYYDPALFAAAGFGRPADNWTKDDFYKIAKAITKKKGSLTTRYGYAWVVRLWGSWDTWIDVNGGDLLEFGRYPGGQWLWNTFYKDDPRAKGRSGGYQWGAPTANLPANLEALQFNLDLINEGITPVPTVTGGGALQGFFASKQLGMTPGGGFWAGGLSNAGLKPDQFNVQFWPKWKTQRTHFGVGTKMIMKSSKNKDAAWEYCKFYASKPAMQLELNGNGTTPTRRSMMTAARYAPTGPKHWQVFYDSLDKDGTRAMAAPTYYTALSNVLDKYTTLAVGGSATAKQALDGMQQEFERLYATSVK